jgi:hypothetical protein
VPPPKTIPDEKSPKVPLDATPEIVLLAINVVPDVAEATAIPAAEYVRLLTTEPIEFPIIDALVTSLPADAVEDISDNPTEIPIASLVPLD